MLATIWPAHFTSDHPGNAPVEYNVHALFPRICTCLHIHVVLNNLPFSVVSRAGSHHGPGAGAVPVADGSRGWGRRIVPQSSVDQRVKNGSRRHTGGLRPPRARSLHPGSGSAGGGGGFVPPSPDDPGGKVGAGRITGCPYITRIGQVYSGRGEADGGRGIFPASADDQGGEARPWRFAGGVHAWPAAAMRIGRRGGGSRARGDCFQHRWSRRPTAPVLSPNFPEASGLGL